MAPRSCPGPARPGLIMAAGSPAGRRRSAAGGCTGDGADLVAAGGFLVDQGGGELLKRPAMAGEQVPGRGLAARGWSSSATGMVVLNGCPLARLPVPRPAGPMVAARTAAVPASARNRE